MIKVFVSWVIFFSFVFCGCVETATTLSSDCPAELAGAKSTSLVSRVDSLEKFTKKMHERISALEKTNKSLEERIASLEKQVKSAKDNPNSSKEKQKTGARFDSAGKCFPDDNIDIPDNSLNIFNTYWDSFNGLMEKGGVYRYSNNGFRNDLQFKVVQVLEEGAVIVFRPINLDEYKGKIQVLCAEVAFVVLSKQEYADGVSLKEGLYECIGTYTYETKKGDDKTVYVLREIDKE